MLQYVEEALEPQHIAAVVQASGSMWVMSYRRLGLKAFVRKMEVVSGKPIEEMMDWGLQMAHNEVQSHF